MSAARRWLASAPLLPAYPEPQQDHAWLTYEQARRLISELPEHLEVLARFSLATGLRESNARLLRWKQVDAARGLVLIPSADAKAGKPLNVPLNADALAVLREVQGQH